MEDPMTIAPGARVTTLVDRVVDMEAPMITALVGRAVVMEAPTTTAPEARVTTLVDRVVDLEDSPVDKTVDSLVDSPRSLGLSKRECRQLRDLPRRRVGKYHLLNWNTTFSWEVSSISTLENR
jgi:hypothetical protein